MRATMKPSEPSQVLQRLKKINLRQAHAILWLVHKRLHAGQATYRVNRVDVDATLEKKLLAMVDRHIKSANIAEAYAAETTDQDDRVFIHPIIGTDFPLLAAQVMQGTDAPKVQDITEFKDAIGTIITI